VTEVRIGCSGWNYAHWRERVYPKGLPPKRWLEHYGTLFDTVEVNSTFYRLPKVPAVRGWVEQSPPGFLFAVKMSRYLTHIRRLGGLETGIPLFYERIEPLARSPKLGPVLWQLPPTFKRDDERLAAALAMLPEGRHAFEFRHPTWYVGEVYDALRLELTADWTFVRFHHGTRGRGGNYSETEIGDWAERIDGWRTDGLDVYAYYNNDWEGYAVKNGLRLRELLGV
jgi:uncharacterized protein YecE (DUF72 family)